jgi:hypothetical protein
VKKFILCEWDHYYPRGGLDNIRGTFDTLDEAKEYADREQLYPPDCQEIYERDTMRSVWERD